MRNESYWEHLGLSQPIRQQRARRLSVDQKGDPVDRSSQSLTDPIRESRIAHSIAFRSLHAGQKNRRSRWPALYVNHV